MHYCYILGAPWSSGDWLWYHLVPFITSSRGLLPALSRFYFQESFFEETGRARQRQTPHFALYCTLQQLPNEQKSQLNWKNGNNQVIKIFFVCVPFGTWNLVFYFAAFRGPSLEGPIIKEFGTKVKEEVTLDIKIWPLLLMLHQLLSLLLRSIKYFCIACLRYVSW